MNDNPNTRQDTTPEQMEPPEVARYDRFVELSRELFSKKGEQQKRGQIYLSDSPQFAKVDTCLDHRD